MSYFNSFEIKREIDLLTMKIIFGLVLKKKSYFHKCYTYLHLCVNNICTNTLCYRPSKNKLN